VCDLENLKNEEAMTHVGSQRHKKKSTCYRVYFIWQLLYMFRASPSPIFRSTKRL